MLLLYNCCSLWPYSTFESVSLRLQKWISHTSFSLIKMFTLNEMQVTLDKTLKMIKISISHFTRLAGERPCWPKFSQDNYILTHCFSRHHNFLCTERNVISFRRSIHSAREGLKGKGKKSGDLQVSSLSSTVWNCPILCMSLTNILKQQLRINYEQIQIGTKKVKTSIHNVALNQIAIFLIYFLTF